MNFEQFSRRGFLSQEQGIQRELRSELTHFCQNAPRFTLWSPIVIFGIPACPCLHRDRSSWCRCVPFINKTHLSIYSWSSFINFNKTFKNFPISFVSALLLLWYFISFHNTVSSVFVSVIYSNKYLLKKEKQYTVLSISPSY